MQLAPLARTAPQAPSAPATLRHIATADNGKLDFFAGKVLRSGVTNIAAAGRELLGEYFAGGATRHQDMSLVAFLRNGDAWDAVELLAAAPGATPARTAQPTQLHALADVPLDAVWLLSDYGGDYSHVVLPATR